MSTYNGEDIFGSGPHKIVVGGEVVMKKRIGYAGANGVNSTVMGGRGWPVRITGQLRSATAAGLNTLIETIEAYTKYPTACTLIDNFSYSYTYVELDAIRLTSNIMCTGTTYIVTYMVTGHKLY